MDESLERAFMVFGLNQVPFLSGVSLSQKLCLARAMELQSYEPQRSITQDVQRGGPGAENQDVQNVCVYICYLEVYSMYTSISV